MAFPTVRSSINTNGTTASATPAVTLPATIRQNDVIFVVFRVAVAGAIGWPAGWSEMFDASADAADDQMAAAWKRAEGTEGGTSITLSCTSGKFAAVAYAIADSADPVIRAPELSTVATGTSTAPNATTCTPTGGAKDYLWLTFTGREGEATLPPTYPTNYSVSQLTGDSGTASTVGTNVRVSAAVRTNNNAASEDAGAWTFSDTEDWTAYTIAFHPPPADPTPGVNKVNAPAMPLRSVLKAAACVLAFVPVIESAPAAADAITTNSGGQLYRSPTVQYTPIAGPVSVAHSLPWASSPPGLVPRIVSVPSIYAAPLMVQQPEVSIPWSPRPLEPVRPIPLISSVYVSPPSVTASAAQNVTWWPELPRLVSRVRFVEPYRADAPVAPTLSAPPASADAVSTSTGPMVWPRGTVHYQAVVGPVLIPAVVTPDRPLSFNDDGIIRPDRYIQYQSVSGPVAIPLDVGWWPQAPRVVRRLEPIRLSVVAKPQQPLDPSGRSDLPWLMPPLPLVRGIPLTRQVIVVPATVPQAGVPTMAWLMPVLPLVQAKYPTRHLLVMPPTVPASALSNLPWLVHPQPLILAKQPTRNQYAQPLTVQAPSIDIPWLTPALPLIQRLSPNRPVVVTPLRPESIDIPWLKPTLALVQQRYPTRSVVVIPPSVNTGALSTLPWLPSPPQLYRAKRDLPSFLAQVMLDNYGPAPTADVIILVQPDVGIIRVKPDVGIILVLPDIGDVET